MKTLGNAIGLTAICTLLAACSTPTHTHLPANLIPAANEQAAFTWSAVGSQIYECKANAAGAFAWTFVAPEAVLFNAKKKSE